MESASAYRASPESRFARKVLVVVLIGFAAYVLWRLVDVLALAFCAVLLALVVRALARGFGRFVGLSARWSVAAVLLLLLAALVSVAFLFGAQVASQFDVLAERLPQIPAQIIAELESRPWSRFLLGQVQDMDLPGGTRQIATTLATVARSMVRTIAFAAVVAFAGVYFSIQPDRYRRGLLQLIPPPRRARAAEVLDLIGATLQRWLLAQSLTMLVIGSLTGFGLWALGVGSPIALGLIAGLFAFIPYVGPILAAIPGLLMAATQGPMMVVYAALLYAGSHLLEGNLITPLVQAEMLRLPPVLMIFAAATFATLLGPLGVLLAAPLTVVILVIMQMLYVEDILGEQRTWPRPR